MMLRDLEKSKKRFLLSLILDLLLDSTKPKEGTWADCTASSVISCSMTITAYLLTRIGG